MKIKSLKLYTNKLEAQKQFYIELLGSDFVTTDINSFTILIGTSTLTFERIDIPANYHFAINIPPHQLEKAIEWTKEKTSLLQWEGNEIVNFPNWNAKAIYFYDESKNIVEFIARENLQVDSQSAHFPENLLHLSEVGIPTSKVEQFFSYANEHYSLDKYDGDLNRFCAIGDETGLFITVNYNVKKWIPNMDDAFPYPFEINFENDKGESFHLRYEDEKLSTLE